MARPGSTAPVRRTADDPLRFVLKRVRLYGANLFRPRLIDFSRAGLSIGFDPGPIVAALAPFRLSMASRVVEEFQDHLSSLERRLESHRGLESVPMAATREESLFLYSLVRLREPERVVETGVASGVSTYFILKALHENGHGTLTSFDVNPDAGPLLRPEEKAGWQFVVLDPRRAKREFEQKLDRGKPVDLFVHDSDHSYGYQSFEYRTLLPLMAEGGLLASDDVDGSFAFLDFCARNGFRAHYLVSRTKVFGIVEVHRSVR